MIVLPRTPVAPNLRVGSHQSKIKTEAYGVDYGGQPWDVRKRGDSLPSPLRLEMEEQQQQHQQAQHLQQYQYRTNRHHHNHHHHHHPSGDQLLSPRQQVRSAMPCLIERLPKELQRMVFSHLDYQTLIHLSTMNRYFHQTIDPQAMSDAADKAQFVMRAAKDFPQHRPSEKGHDYKPGNFECYICFRVRAPDHFDMLQPHSAYLDRHGRVVRDREPNRQADRLVHLRRFCVGCGVKEGLHAPFDCLTTRTGRDLWVCRCRRVWSKPGCLRCPYCRGDCPLRPRRKMLDRGGV